MFSNSNEEKNLRRFLRTKTSIFIFLSIKIFISIDKNVFKRRENLTVEFMLLYILGNFFV